MKILYLTQYFPPDKGAGQIRAWEMARNLTRLGHRVTVLTEFPNHPLGVVPARYRGELFRREMCNGIEVIRSYVKASPKKDFFSRLVFYLSFMITTVMAALKLRRKYDLVYGTSSPLFVGLAGYLISRLKGISFVFEVRDIWPEAAVVVGELRNKLLIRLACSVERLCYQKSSKVVVVTEGYRRNLLDRDVDPQKVDVVYNGANTDLFKPMAENQDRRAMQDYQGKFLVVYAGNFGLIHGMNHLVEVCRILASTEGIQFLFIGEGPMKVEVIRLRDRHGLSNLVIMDDVPTNELVSYLHLADVCLVPTMKSELTSLILPVKMFDAWACGKPIILSVDGEAKAHLQRAKAGIWVEPEDSEGIAAAIRYLQDNPQLCEEYGRNGRQYVEKHFTRRAQAEKLERVLLELVGQH